ncbi:hypothetical protein OGATHE_006721 [Ogataea polymorpha]|uniref:Uncharacterized protein n=1 Tax=Ogataea polymorpha TaxID=460523 RepID=A0A9P8NSG0_9ASCO|nr:hypothetical protein OGATHE_006721 [Ogataea polymorpha]
MCSGSEPAKGRITIPINTLDIGLSSVRVFRDSTKKFDVGPRPATETSRAMKQTLSGKISSSPSNSESLSESLSSSESVSNGWPSRASSCCLLFSFTLFIDLNSSFVETTR